METMQDVKAKNARKNPEKREGRVATATEVQKTRIPSDIFFWATVGIMAVSVGYKMVRKGNTSGFIDRWTPAAVLLFGIYSKMAKRSVRARS
jgi:hypothetical protein